MAALLIDGITVPVRQGAHEEAIVWLEPSDESYAGEWLSRRTPSWKTALTKEWPGIETPPLDAATARTLEAALSLPGRRTAKGYLVSDPAEVGVAVYVDGLERIWGDNSNEFGLRFTLIRAEPPNAVPATGGEVEPEPGDSVWVDGFWADDFWVTDFWT